MKRERSHPLERVEERSLPELLLLARGYCEFNGVDPSDNELLAVFRALIADPAREGVQFLARDRDGHAAGFASLFWTWGTWAAGRIGILGDLYVAPQARGTGIDPGSGFRSHPPPPSDKRVRPASLAGEPLDRPWRHPSARKSR